MRKIAALLLTLTVATTLLISPAVPASAGTTSTSCEAAGYKTKLQSKKLHLKGKVVGEIRTLKKKKGSKQLCTYVLKRGSFYGKKGNITLKLVVTRQTETTYSKKISGSWSKYSDGITYTIPANPNTVVVGPTPQPRVAYSGEINIKGKRVNFLNGIV